MGAIRHSFTFDSASDYQKPNKTIYRSLIKCTKNKRTNSSGKETSETETSNMKVLLVLTRQPIKQQQTETETRILYKMRIVIISPSPNRILMDNVATTSSNYSEWFFTKSNLADGHAWVWFSSNFCHLSSSGPAIMIAWQFIRIRLSYIFMYWSHWW